MRIVFCASHAIAELFSPDECSAITKLCERHPVRDGQVWTRTGYAVDRRIRDLRTAYVPRNDETQWIFDRMDQLFVRVASRWRIDVDRTVEDLKFMVYRKGSHFAAWHSDVGSDYSRLRRLSMSVELCASQDYEGGDLQIFPAASGHVAGENRPAGIAIVFPSNRRHRITPVTRGVRRSLVNWISAAASESTQAIPRPQHQRGSSSSRSRRRGQAIRV